MRARRGLRKVEGKLGSLPAGPASHHSLSPLSILHSNCSTPSTATRHSQVCSPSPSSSSSPPLPPSRSDRPPPLLPPSSSPPNDRAMPDRRPPHPSSADRSTAAPSPSSSSSHLRQRSLTSSSSLSSSSLPPTSSQPPRRDSLARNPFHDPLHRPIGPPLVPVPMPPVQHRAALMQMGSHASLTVVDLGGDEGTMRDQAGLFRGDRAEWVRPLRFFSRRPFSCDDR